MQPASESFATANPTPTGYGEAAWQMFETFNLSVGFGQPAPYATYTTLRSESPVHAGLPHLGIYSFLRLLLPAGAETTYRSSSSLLVALLSDPEQLDAVREDPASLTAAVNEAVRWETPLQFVPRLATRDTELAGVRIPAGATVMVVIGAANHDPARWDEPERFDLHRPYKPALAFGHGVHMCIGMHLSKMETEDLVRALLDSLPGLRLDPDCPAPTIEGTLMRSPAHLNVVWDA
jgi:cytochrome P450